MSGNKFSQMVLGKQFYDETVLEYVYIAVLLYAFYQRVLYLGTGRVFVVQYPKFGVSALLVQVERAVGCFIEIDAPLEELFYLFGSVGYYLLYRTTVADTVARNESVFYMFFVIIEYIVGNLRNTSLRQHRIGFGKFCLAQQCYAAFMSYFQSKAHTCDTAAYYHEIIFFLHNVP